MSQTTRKDAENRMVKSIEALRAELAKLRTGRANTGLLEHVRVDYYGTPTPISQVATVTVTDARTLTVTPWDKNVVPALEKAIRDAGLGLNPVSAGQAIRVPLPALTEERRKEMARVVRAEGENGKVAIRNARRDALHHLKELLKKKEMAEDEEKRAEEEIQKLTDRYIAEIDKLVAAKEKDLMAL